MSVSIVKLIYYLIISFVIGTIAQLITGYHKRRIFTTFVLGFIGVLAGDLIADYFGLPHIIRPFFGVSLLWSVVGAVIFILAFRLIRGRW